MRRINSKTARFSEREPLDLGIPDIGEYEYERHVDKRKIPYYIFYTPGTDHQFLRYYLKTFEVRTDPQLAKLLVEKYDTVMESRYFGKNGVEVVLFTTQLSQEEAEDLIRLSYNLTLALEK